MIICHTNWLIFTHILMELAKENPQILFRHYSTNFPKEKSDLGYSCLLKNHHFRDAFD